MLNYYASKKTMIFFVGKNNSVECIMENNYIYLNERRHNKIFKH